MKENQLIIDGELAYFISIKENVLTVETDEYEYDFNLTDAQVKQCHQQLAQQEIPTFTINPSKNIIIFDVDTSLKESEEINNIIDYYFSINDIKATKIYCTIEDIYLVDTNYYANIITEKNEKRTIYLDNEAYELVRDIIDKNINNEVLFIYNPEHNKILFNEINDYDVGDLQLGNMISENEGE